MSGKELALRIALNPFVWVAVALIARMFFGNPGRRPFDEDMTDEPD
jgi:hypothetical protein